MAVAVSPECSRLLIYLARYAAGGLVLTEILPVVMETCGSWSGLMPVRNISAHVMRRLAFCRFKELERNGALAVWLQPLMPYSQLVKEWLLLLDAGCSDVDSLEFYRQNLTFFDAALALTALDLRETGDTRRPFVRSIDSHGVIQARTPEQADMPLTVFECAQLWDMMFCGMGRCWLLGVARRSAARIIRCYFPQHYRRQGRRVAEQDQAIDTHATVMASMDPTTSERCRATMQRRNQPAGRWYHDETDRLPTDYRYPESFQISVIQAQKHVQEALIKLDSDKFSRCMLDLATGLLARPGDHALAAQASPIIEMRPSGWVGSLAERGYDCGALYRLFSNHQELVHLGFTGFCEPRARSWSPPTRAHAFVRAAYTALCLYCLNDFCGMTYDLWATSVVSIWEFFHREQQLTASPYPILVYSASSLAVVHNNRYCEFPPDAVISAATLYVRLRFPA